MKNKEVDKGGRPTKMDEATTSKLIESFKHGHGIDYSCQFAKISTPTFYRHYNGDEEFRSQIDDAKNYWAMVAADNITKYLSGEVSSSPKIVADLSKWALEKKEPKEFGKAEPIPPGTQNNYLFITNDQLREYLSAKNIAAIDPTTIVEGAITPDMAGGEAEGSPMEIH